MSASLPLIVNNAVIETLGVNGSIVTSILGLFVVLVLLSTFGLKYGRLCWRSRVTEDTSQRQVDDDQPLHGISEQKKQRILAEMENKHRDFKQRQELQAENRALKSQVYQQKKKFSELSDVKQECDETIEQMKDKVTKAGEKNYVLILELSELDHRLDLERKHLEEKEMSLNETRTSLNETQMTLEETERELYEIQRTLRQTIEQEQKLRMDLIEDYKHLENRLKEEQNRRRAMEASLRRQLSQCQEELEQAKRSHKAAMDKCQSEKHALQEQINTHKKHHNELEETLKRERQKHNTDMKVMQDQLTECTEENKGYKKALELMSIEKTNLIAEHKQLLGRFEAVPKELDMYTGRLKQQTETRNTHNVVYHTGESFHTQTPTKAVKSEPQEQCPSPGRCYACQALLGGKCTSDNVTYELTCDRCPWTHNGQTKRKIRDRILEYRRAAINRSTDNPVGRHYVEKHGGLQTPNIPFKVKITGKAAGSVER